MNLQQAVHALQCPLCKSGFSLNAGYSLACEQGHCFDISARGSVNFLPNQRATKYSGELFESRRRMLAAGLFQGLEDAIAETIGRCNPGPGRMLDAGCGEGYLLRRLCERFPRAGAFGMDIEKQAVRVAARGEKRALWVVGDIANMPFRPQSMDIILNIFSPSNYAGFSKVLGARGSLIKAIPGGKHMREIREALSMGREAGESFVAERFAQRFALAGREKVTYEFPVSEEMLPDLLRMSPLLFDIRPDAAAFSGIQKITIDAEILVGKPM